MRRLLCIVSTFCLLFCMAGCHSVPTKTPTNPAEEALLELTDKIHLSGELIQYYLKKDVLRAECISPGLDSYTLSVTLYSLTEHKVLGTVNLGESDWYTDWTDSGFYVASLSEKSVRLYDNSCQLIETKSIPNTLGHISFFLMNESADTYFIGTGETSTLYLYDVTTDTAKDIGQMLYGYQNPLGYRDGYFYLEGEEDLLRIHEHGEYATTVYCDSQHLYKFIDMGIGNHNDHFYIVPANTSDKAVYVPMHENGEYPVAALDSRFATLTEHSGNDGVDTVRIYNLADKTMCELRYAAVQSVHFYGDQVLISTYDGKQQRLYLCTPNLVGKDRVSFTTSTMADNSQAPSSSSTVVKPLPTSHLIDVPLIPQMPDYPTGCESVSAVMALCYWGEIVSVADFVDDYLPKSAYFYNKDGVYYGPSPFQYFVGDPRTTNSYGCMAPVIQRALNSYFGSSNRVLNVTGTSLSQLCAQHIVENRPVLVWVTINMKETFTRAQWRLEDGTIYDWPANEHCMVLVGYDEHYYYFNDPYNGQLVKYEHTLSEDRFAALGQQALVITETKKTSDV